MAHGKRKTGQTIGDSALYVAKAALEKGDVSPILKWIKTDSEAEIKAAFKKAVAVRSKGTEAKELADQYFLETLVRLHRAGEGTLIPASRTSPQNRSSPWPTKPWPKVPWTT